MNVKKKGALYLVPLLINGCSSSENVRYKDLSYLEKPPVIIIAETAKKAVIKDKETVEKTGLGKVVSLAGPADLPILKIKKIFDRAWDIVEQGLKLAEIEITDKNRDKGVFYLKFDPNQQDSKDLSLLGNIDLFLFKNEYAEATYKLTVEWRDSDTEVNIELLAENADNLLDDNEIEDSIDSGAKLIKVLYKTIRDDLPIVNHL